MVRIEGDNKGGTAMSIIKDGIEYGLFGKNRGFYLWSILSNKDLQILTAITVRQKKKFKNEKLIPYPLLQFFWKISFLPIMKRPADKGMRVPAFLNLLSNGEYMNERHRYQGIWLRDRVEAEEYPKTIKTNELYLKVRGEGSKWVPVSYYKDIPGTIFR